MIAPASPPSFPGNSGTSSMGSDSAEKAVILYSDLEALVKISNRIPSFRSCQMDPQPLRLRPFLNLLMEIMSNSLTSLKNRF